ncbi:MAG: SDR family oxidoreductase [Deltaproteobacteria bacterium]|nr:SDR family oxidoreductase [Deltaproteobacteria bacterium]
MKALVTGAAGFIGAHVARQLAQAGHRVRALHRPGEDTSNLAGLDLERVAGDVTDLAGMRAAMAGCDQVFHLAAIYALWLPDPRRMHAVNVGGTATVLRAAREAGVRRVVHCSSIARFGGQGAGVRATEQSRFALGPTGDAYAQSKADAHEVAVRAAADGQDVVIVAPCGPIGPGDIGPTPTGRLLCAVLSLPLVTVVDSVTSFADVRDIAAGHLLAAEHGVSGQSYLLGHRDLSMVELARLAMQVAGVRRPVLSVPLPIAGAAARVALTIADRVTRRAPLITPAAVEIARLGLAADCSRAVRELGLPQTPMEIALRDALRWFAQHGKLRLPARAARHLALA